MKFWWRSGSLSGYRAGLFSGFVIIGRYGKWLTCISLLLLLICQITALVRHALAEVCTVPLLLVHYLYHVYDTIIGEPA